MYYIFKKQLLFVGAHRDFHPTHPLFPYMRDGKSFKKFKNIGLITLFAIADHTRYTSTIYGLLHTDLVAYCAQSSLLLLHNATSFITPESKFKFHSLQGEHQSFK